MQHFVYEQLHDGVRGYLHMGGTLLTDKTEGFRYRLMTKSRTTPLLMPHGIRVQ